MKEKRMASNVKCVACKSSFRVKPSWVKERKFCTKKCKYSSPQWRDLQRKIWTGRKHSSTTKEKLRQLNLGKWKADRSPLWKGGKKNYWRSEVLRRDSFKCQECGNDDIRVLNADHIKSKAVYPELQFDLTNGITLCANCHAIKTLEDTELYKWKYAK